MTRIRFYIVFTLFLFTTALGATNSPSIFDAIGYEELANVSIELDVDAITTNWRSEEKHPATLSYKDAGGELQTWDIKVKLRGKFRRMRCSGIPPLKIYFDKDALKTAGLAKHNDFKLVNHCPEDAEIAKDLIMREYLGYKIYNELSEESFRVQLLKITYKDTQSNRKMKQFGFLIEDTAQLRKRIGAAKYKKTSANGGDIPFVKEQMQTMAVFQYMIGNTDWNWRVEKNLKFVAKNDKVLAIPYDFDFAGLVNAPYAVPNSNYGLSTLTERVYLGFPEDLATIEPVLEHFRAKEAAIFSLIKTSKLLKSSTKKEMLDYIDSFYLTLSVETLSSAVREENYSPTVKINENTSSNIQPATRR